jgi:hypothetical protein
VPHYQKDLDQVYRCIGIPESRAPLHEVNVDEARRGQLGLLAEHGSQGQPIDVRHAAVEEYERVQASLSHAAQEDMHRRRSCHGVIEQRPAVNPCVGTLCANRDERRRFSRSEKMCLMATGLAYSLGIRPACRKSRKTPEKRGIQRAVPDLSMV